jgi:hypothetical protein
MNKITYFCIYNDINFQSDKMGLFKNMAREKALIDKELKFYEKNEKLKIDKGLEDYRQSTHAEKRDLAIQCADDTKKNEHKFHSNQEKLGIAIAKLEAKKEHLEEITSTDKTAYERIIKGKDEEIERLSGILEKMVENQPNAIIQVKD